jgi:16S rRNA (guanine527-N7)-methyltransferase
VSGAPPPPPEAVAVFGDRLELAAEYAELLATDATVRGLIGPAEVPRLWVRHLLNCAVLGELIAPDTRVIDVGSGAGLPGVPLAIARPDLEIVLVEPLSRRSGWLEATVNRLGLSSVSVRRARAEDLAGAVSAPVVTARAVAPLARLASWCLPLVAPGGELLAMKGQSAASEVEAAGVELRRLGAVAWEVLPIGVEILLDHTSVVRVRVGTDAGAARASGSGRRVPQQPMKRSGQRARQRDRGGNG